MSDEYVDPSGDGGPLDPAGRALRARRSRPPSRARYGLRRALALFVLVVLLFGAWFAVELFQPFTGSGSGRVTVVIPRGASGRQIGDQLAARGIVASGFFFNLRAIIDGDRSKLRAGTFTLRHGMSYAAALAALTKVQPVVTTTVRLTIPEGYTRAQIAALARADGLRGSYLVASRSSRGLDPRRYGAPSRVRDLEGFLFPATYFLSPEENVKRLVAEQLTAFGQNFGQLDLATARARGLSPYDVLIIASMIEREAAAPSDRRLVSAVVYNRLRAGMTLGIDATLRYHLKNYTQPLTQSELALDTPYNTRLHHGLPPTPISNPGLASMEAAANPASVTYLYYVNKPNTCNKLSFATTYTQFLADAAAYDAARSANGGRAPTKCP